MLKKTFKSIGVGGLAILLHAHSAFASVADVWGHHIQAWEARSVSEIVADYTDESVLVLNNKVFKGRTEIAQVFTGLFRIFDVGVNRIDTPIILDRFVYITWHFTPPGKEEFFGTDTFVIEGGEIVLQTIASPLYDQYPIFFLRD